MGNLQRLSENQQAYSLLLGSVRGLAEGTLCPSLQRSLQHLCTGLQGLLISIAGVMSGLGYPLPPSAAPTGHLKPSVLLPRNLGDFSGFGEVILTERPLLRPGVPLTPLRCPHGAPQTQRSAAPQFGGLLRFWGSDLNRKTSPLQTCRPRKPRPFFLLFPAGPRPFQDRPRLFVRAAGQ
ncbi:UNVERIFIED_CONTAM: hypothetical protein FKN15_047974 [Acipenser sinensis]